MFWAAANSGILDHANTPQVNDARVEEVAINVERDKRVALDKESYSE